MERAAKAAHVARAERFLDDLRRWVDPREDIRACLLVGSFARREGRPDSDVDVVLLAEDPSTYVKDTVWTGAFGSATAVGLERYGRVTSVRARYSDGLEVEFSFATADWASPPVDPGTAEVARGGVLVLLDRDGHATALASSVTRAARTVTVKPSEFYTGLVADMYDALVSYRAPAAFYAKMIRSGGEPALELSCGTGHPLLDLVEAGLSVEGLDSSQDMLAKCEVKARARGLRVRLHQQEMQSFTLPTRYRTIFFAGASFMLLSEAGDAGRTLQRIHHHLEPGGQAIIPLYVPPLSPEARNATDQWAVRESIRECDRATLRVSERFHLDCARQLRVATLHYEVIKGGTVVQEVERPWLLRWYSQQEFRCLLHDGGFESIAVLGEDGGPATEHAAAFVFRALRPSAA